jgi:hypothetical protein
MQKINVDGLELNDKIIAELKKWYTGNGCQSVPEEWLLSLNDMKNTFIRLLCVDANEMYSTEITESLRLILIMQDSLENLSPSN